MNFFKFGVSIASVLLLTSTVALADSAVDTIINMGTTQAFTDEAVSDDDLNTILQAGLSAPSAINQQPWHFVAITNKEIIQEIKDAGSSFAPPAGGNAPSAPAPASGSAKAALGDSPAAIIIYMDKSTPSPDPDFDCGLAAENMAVAAASLGYGVKIVSSPTMTLNGDNHDSLCEKLGVDSSLQAVAVLLIGKKDTDVVSNATTRSPMEEKVTIIH